MKIKQLLLFRSLHGVLAEEAGAQERYVKNQDVRSYWTSFIIRDIVSNGILVHDDISRFIQHSKRSAS